MTFLFRLAIFAATFAGSDHLPPLAQVVVDDVIAIESVTVGGFECAPDYYFVGRVHNNIRYIDSRSFGYYDRLPEIEQVPGGWRMFWYDHRDQCYRMVYAEAWLVSDFDGWDHAPRAIGRRLTKPAGRWW